MLPLTLLKGTENHPMLIELKNGDTYNGTLVSCNTFMNICLKVHSFLAFYSLSTRFFVPALTHSLTHSQDVIVTSRDGERFWKIPECYIRGNSIKYLRIPDEIIDVVINDSNNRNRQAFRGVRGGRGGRLGRGEGGRSEGGRSEGGRSNGGRGEGGRGGGRGEGGRGGRGGGRGDGRGGGRGDGRGGGREQGRGGRDQGRGGRGQGGRNIHINSDKEFPKLGGN